MNAFDHPPSARVFCWPCQTRAGELLLGAVAVIVMVVMLYIQHH